MVDGVGSNSVSFDGGGWALRKGSTYSCYYPFVCDMKLKRDAIPVSFANQVQNGVSNFDGIRFFLASEGTSSSAGTLRFTFQMLNTVIRIKAIGLPAGTYTKLTLTTEDDLFVQEGTFGLGDMEITGKMYSNTLELSLNDVVLTETSTEANPALFYLTTAPVDLSGKTVTIQAYSEDGSIFKCEKKPSKAYEAGAWGGLKCNMAQPNNVIYYTSTDGSIVVPYKTDVFGADYLTSTYENGRGIFAFSGDVTTIGNSAFYGCEKINSIILPDSVTEIKAQAFSRTHIGSILIPKSVIRLSPLSITDSYVEVLEVDPDNTVFDSRNDCNAVIETATNSLVLGTCRTTIPETVTSIAQAAFSNDRWITGITIPSSVTSIGNYAFMGCTGLGSITVLTTTPPTGGSNMFDGSYCPIYVPAESVDAYKLAAGWSTYADRIQAIPQPNNVIYYTSSDGEVVNPDKANVFGASIVSNTYSDEQGIITFDGDVTSIGQGAFYNCSRLTSISLPSSILTIGELAFYNCGLTSIVIPEGVTSLSAFAFKNNLELTTASIPSSITHLEYLVFHYCSKLSSFTGGYLGITPDSRGLSVENYTYDSVNYGTMLTDTALFGLESYEVPSTIQCIASSEPIYSSSLKRIIIPDSVEYIFSNAIYASNLEEIYIGKGIKGLHSKAISGRFGKVHIRAMVAPSVSSDSFNTSYSNSLTLYYPEGATGYDSLVSTLNRTWHLVVE